MSGRCATTAGIGYPANAGNPNGGLGPTACVSLGRRLLPTPPLTLILCAALSGCANLPGDPSKLSAEQLRELSKDRSASAACSTAMTPWGPVRTIFVQLDQKTIINGTVTVDESCKVTINSAQKVEAPEAAKAKAAESLQCYRSNGAIVCENLK